VKKIELEIAAIAPTNTPQYVIVMKEKEGWKRLPIVIGTTEAHAIAIELENVTRPRPLTHDLFVNTLSAFGILINEIVITKVEEGVFFSELVCEQTATGTVIRIDSRTSDAIALAIRFRCKIFTYEDVMTQAAFSVKDIKKDSNLQPKNEHIKNKIDILNNKLKDAIEKEDYELASRLRDQIAKLKNELE